MNRAERRRNEKAMKKDPHWNLRASDVQQIKANANKQAVDVALELMFCLPVMWLHDKKGWGEKRLTELVNGVLELYDSFERGYITLDDLRETLKTETGVEIDLSE